MNPIPVIFQWTGSVHKSNLQTERATSSSSSSLPSYLHIFLHCCLWIFHVFFCYLLLQPSKDAKFIVFDPLLFAPVRQKLQFTCADREKWHGCKILTFLSGVQELYIFSVHECFWHIISLEDKDRKRSSESLHLFYRWMNFL